MLLRRRTGSTNIDSLGGANVTCVSFILPPLHARQALRPLGVALLEVVVRLFGGVIDPLAPPAKLLALYQAQLVSALRASLAEGASPELRGAGATLAAAFLQAGLAAGDATVLNRLMGLLATPLARWGGSAPSLPAAAAAQQAQQAQQPAVYAEWVEARARVALLEAHARCALLAGGAGDEATQRVVARAQSTRLPQLLEGWVR